MVFTSSKILLDRETVALEFKKAREERKINLEEAARKLNINLKYLEAIEEGRFDKLPAGIYGKKILEEYSSFLKLNTKDVLEFFEDNAPQSNSQKSKDLFSKQTVKQSQFMATPKIIRNVVIVSLALICLVYLGYRMGKIMSPPTLSLYYPEENLVTDKNDIMVIGVAEAESEIIVNGEPVLSDKDGNFSKKINLKEGVNTVTVTAKKKFGRENTIRRQILVKH